MKELIELSIKIGFVPSERLNFNSQSNKYIEYLWMCELQKWLRDQYNIHTWSQPFVLKKNSTSTLPKKPYSYFIFKDGGYIGDISYFIEFEKAFEAGLVAALKLINP